MQQNGTENELTKTPSCLKSSLTLGHQARTLGIYNSQSSRPISTHKMYEKRGKYIFYLQKKHYSRVLDISQFFSVEVNVDIFHFWHSWLGLLYSCGFKPHQPQNNFAAVLAICSARSARIPGNIQNLCSPGWCPLLLTLKYWLHRGLGLDCQGGVIPYKMLS